MKVLNLAVLLLASSAHAFTIPKLGWSRQQYVPLRVSVESSTDTDPLGLPAELRKVTDAFASVPDAQLRHKQLLYMANLLPKIDPAKCTPENKVPGCLSTVFIDGTATWSEEKQANVINFVGDSDGLLTKGLVALLVRGLSGSTADEIQKVDPQFIQAAEIGPTLTPGRNNGFLNMLATMKKKAVQLDRDASDSSDSAQLDATTALDLDSDAPMYNGIISALQMLKPTKLVLVDNSDQHAGHAGNKGFNGESHFELEIVADAFTGLNLVKRHQLIYLMLREIMPKIHALQIRANTPDEVGQPE